MRQAARVAVLFFVVIGTAWATSQVDLVSPDAWRTVENPFGVTYPVLAITRVIDGDTFQAWVHIAPRLAYFADVRLDGVDTPEVTGACKAKGIEVTARVEQVLRAAKAITVKVTAVDSFGRWVCAVSCDGQDLSTWIRDNRLTKADLCP